MHQVSAQGRSRIFNELAGEGWNSSQPKWHQSELKTKYERPGQPSKHRSQGPAASRAWWRFSVFGSAAPLLGRLRLHRSVGSTPKARANERCALVDAPASRDEAIRLGERGAGSLALADIQRTRCLTKELQQRNIPSILRPDAPDGVTDHRHDRCSTSREKREANLLTASKASQHYCANGDRKEQ